MRTFEENIQNMQLYYQQHGLSFLIKKTSLGQLLGQAISPSPWLFFRTYFSSWWWNRWWLSSWMNEEATQRFEDVTYALEQLQPYLFNEINVNRVVSHRSPAELRSAFCILKRSQILTQNNLALIIEHANAYDLASAFFYLAKAGILTIDNKEVVTAHARLHELIFVFYYLAQAGLFTQDNFILVTEHPRPISLSIVLCELKRAALLSQDYFRLVVEHPSPGGLYSVFHLIDKARLFTKANLVALFLPNHRRLFDLEVWQRVWSRIPIHLLSQANYQRLLMAAEHEEPLQELEQVINDIIGIVVAPLIPANGLLRADFNPHQSTHTASVHRSVSAAVCKLMAIYGHWYFAETIAAMQDYVISLEDTPKHAAAKRCVARTTTNDNQFTDSSGVSMLQLLVLTWVAIHDETKRQGRLEDALILFIDGLYEIQRGYNFNESGIDDGQADSPICFAGAFNKMLEKLNGIHADVGVDYITFAGASVKFPKLAQEQARSYLQSLANPETAKAYRQIFSLLNLIQTDGSLAPIWDEIKAGVSDALWDEFKEAFGNNRSDHRFIDILNNGQYLPAVDVSLLQTQIQASAGYQAYLAVQQELSLYSLWSNRHCSVENQQAFDQQYGLVMRL